MRRPAVPRLMTNPASRSLRRPGRQSGLTERHENYSLPVQGENRPDLPMSLYCKLLCD